MPFEIIEEYLDISEINKTPLVLDVRVKSHPMDFDFNILGAVHELQSHGFEADALLVDDCTANISIKRMGSD